MITKPTLLLDESKCKENIKKMCAKAKRSGVELRAHFKTHQSLKIGSWFRTFGVEKITVSSFEMARYFATEWDDITVAFPTNILEIETINSLAKDIQLNLVAESVETIEFLTQHLKHQVGLFIKIDTGYQRTGLAPYKTKLIDKLIALSQDSENIIFKGFLTHAGHTYKCRLKDEIIEIHKQTINAISDLRNRYKAKFPNMVISVGDTPSCSVADDFPSVNEIRPGNFVFYDLSQHQIGSCSVEQIAVAMACPIVAIHEDRNEIVIYGGGVHFSKERLDLENNLGGTIFGRVVEKEETGWGGIIPNMNLTSLSQEHGLVSVPESQISKHKIGDCLLILPVHSCMTANLMGEYITTTDSAISRL